MTDPLRPFADVIRSLWRSKTANARKAQGVAVGSRAGGSASAAPAVGSETLQSRLKARIAALDPANPRKLRETFVETVLLAQFGEQLAPDPAFADLVVRVSEQLDSDQQTGERLHHLLLDLGGLSGAPPPKG